MPSHDQPAVVEIACVWCGAWCELPRQPVPVVCAHCSHEANVPKRQCRCAKCREPYARTLPTPEEVAAAVAWLRDRRK